MAVRISSGLANAMLGTTGFTTAMNNGVIYLYSGTWPNSADDAETSGSALLAKITANSGAFTSGVATNGLQWNTPVLNVISSLTGQVWSGVGLIAGYCGWFRFYANTVVTGASTTGVRFDGRVSGNGGGGELALSSTSIVVGATISIQSAAFTLNTGV